MFTFSIGWMIKYENRNALTDFFETHIIQNSKITLKIVTNKK